ncbi:ESF1 homolog [Mytilus trossulus]|uniref:ESF1 homolog n=1 Tax=Mytilus trossulus TaxID=6551 RepID=UPI0030041DE9
MDEINKDSRFSQIKNDPKFRRMPRKEKKVKIDKRFKDMFSDKKFKLKYSVDKRGRPVQTTTDENFKKYYDISDSDEDDDDDDKEKEKEEEEDDEEVNGDESNEIPKKSSQKQKLKNTLKQSSDVHDEPEESPDDEKEEEEDKEEESESDESGLGSGPDLARGEGNVETSSEEEESDEEEFDNDDNLVINIADLDKDAVEAPEITSRLAVCNLDWDRVKAQDIFVLLQSFKPTGGLIKYVKVYPSEFGIKRMEMEALKGPMELTETPLANQDSNEQDDQDDEEGGGFHTEKLRRYQLNRLKYYYAVVECDSQETANKIYEECDNMEYESSSNKLDLRFIPEDMTFDHEPKTVCTEPPTSYTPSLYFTTALCQSKVDLTWDETDQDRLKVTMNPSIGKRTKKGKGEVKEEDFKAYLASSSEDEDEDKAGSLGNLDFGDEESESDNEEQQINKYKSLVQSIKESEEKKKKRDVEMEITWEPGLKESAEKIIKKKEKEKGMTVWDKYLEKKKEKKQTKRDDRKKQDKSKEEDSESGSGDEEAFSDDDVPEDLKSDPFFQHSDDEDNPKLKKKTKGKKKIKGKETPEEKELKEKQKAELSLLMMDEDNDEDDKKHFSLKKLVQNDSKKKKKKLQKGKLESKKEDEDEFKIDTKDPRFEALYTSHMYNVDPSAPEYKKTKGMKDIIDAKQIFRKTDNKRKSSQIDENVIKTKTAKVNDGTTQTKDTSLQKLVESVKMKTKHFKNKK